MRFHTVVLICATLFVVSSLASAHAGSCPGVDRAVAAIAEARASLIAMTPHDLDTDISAEAGRGIEREKDAIVALIDAQMQCAAGGSKSKTVERALADAVRNLPGQCAKDCDKPENEIAYVYAGPPTFAVNSWPASPERIGVVATMPIMCGDDAMLIVYERDGASWRRRIRWRSAPYKTVGGAFWSFDYELSPRDEHGGWYALTKDIAPWCSSTWSSIEYTVLRPADDGAKVVLKGEDFMWWGNEDFGSLVANANDFDVRFHGASMDSGVHNRTWIRHYTIDGDHVQRVQPVALNARDFADEWIQTNWSQASQWSDAKAAGLQRWHEHLRGKGDAFYEFASLRACSGRNREVEVAICSTDDDKSYFLRVADTGPFTLRAVTTKPSEDCRGKDQLESMQEK